MYYCFKFQQQKSPLMLAVNSDAADCVKLLLEHKECVYDEDGYYALCSAIINKKK